MAKPNYPESFYESHFVRDESGKVIGLRFGDRLYLAAGEPKVEKKYEPPLGQGKLNPTPTRELERKVGDREALRLIDLVNLNRSLPAIEDKDGNFYVVNLAKYRPQDGNKIYVEVLDEERRVQVYEGPSNLGFPNLNKGQRILEGQIYGAANINRIRVYK